ncbi:hypothetical protein LMG33818_001644 [Halomonadaceae bacterium LMG 33818]|uniref:hypothetical protein n=1 Tax=Cernens ardua TaxID=3402176 RepID=UPI003EDBEB06
MAAKYEKMQASNDSDYHFHNVQEVQKRQYPTANIQTINSGVLSQKPANLDKIV